MWTHFYANGNGRVRGYTLTDCETCSRQIAAPNTITLRETPDRLRALGLTELHSQPAEGWYDDDSGAEVCEYCAG